MNGLKDGCLEIMKVWKFGDDKGHVDNEGAV